MHDTRQEHESFVSMDTRVGSWSNPAEYPGLAHFLEHMLFQATDVNLMEVLYFYKPWTQAQAQPLVSFSQWRKYERLH